jgi:phosphoglucosamine mutase
MGNATGNRLFGTDGIRGVAGQFPLDARTVELIGRALVANLARELGRPPLIVIGRDTRESGHEIEIALAKGACAARARVESAGVITTPGVAFITRVTPFDAGVVISASHNPYTDNGIKVFSPSGRKLPDEMERRVEEELANLLEALPSSGPIEGQPVGYGDAQAEHFRQRYIGYLVNEVGSGLSLAGVRIGVDCANGAASRIAPQVFEALGAEVETISASADGRNINDGCGSLHPEQLRQLVVEQGLDLGVAFDGDADRALFVDEGGGLVDGDQVLLLLADHMKSTGSLDGNIVVATVMSNIGLEVALAERGITLLRTPVGDRYVLEELLSRGGMLGGEQSGHVIFPAISLAGDGIITAIEVLRAKQASKRTLKELASQLTRFPQVLINVRVRAKPPIETLPSVKCEIERLESRMQGRGRILVRYSGTEDLARVMIEGEDQADIQQQANRIAQLIRDEIG